MAAQAREARWGAVGAAVGLGRCCECASAQCLHPECRGVPAGSNSLRTQSVYFRGCFHLPLHAALACGQDSFVHASLSSTCVASKSVGLLTLGTGVSSAQAGPPPTKRARVEQEAPDVQGPRPLAALPAAPAPPPRPALPPPPGAPPPPAARVARLPLPPPPPGSPREVIPPPRAPPPRVPQRRRQSPQPQGLAAYGHELGPEAPQTPPLLD